MVLMVIDVQKGIVNEDLYGCATLVDGICKLMEIAREKGIEVIHVQHDDGPGSGFTVGDEDFEIYDKFKPAGNEKVFYKTINSAFGNEDLASYLETLEDKTLIIVGLQTNFCIDATIKSAFEREYKVIVPSYCNSTFDNDYMNAETTYKYYNEMMWPDRFATCISVDETIALMN